MRDKATPQLHALRAGSGPSVLFLHGIGATASAWRRQFDRLAGRFTLIAPDLPGYGDSPDPVGPPDLDRLVDELANFARAHAPLHVVGVSFGALCALALARRYPASVESLVLADATLGRAMLAGDERARWVAGRYALADDLQLRAAERAAEIAGPGAPADVVAEIAATMRRARPAGYRAVTDIIAATDAGPWLHEIALPALVLCGEHDRVVGLPLSERIAATMPTARLAVIPGAGHAPHIEAADSFAEAVSAFIDGVEHPSSEMRRP